MQVSMRPSKDRYYLSIAQVVSSRSSCLRAHYGAVLVNHDRIISTGYNGNPRGLPNCCDVGRCTKEDPDHNSSPESYNVCRSVHAEMNALMQATPDELDGATLYLWGEILDIVTWKTVPATPCPICLRMLMNAGVCDIISIDGRRPVMEVTGCQYCERQGSV